LHSSVEPGLLKAAIYLFDHSFVFFVIKYTFFNTGCWFWWAYSYFVTSKRGP
jgi:hypothetical protein